MGLLGIGIFAVGQQDYEAWQAAREEAALIAYKHAPPELVNAGYEANAVHVILPEYEREGSVDFEAARSFLVLGPTQNLRLKLSYAGPNDPRPGVRYNSLAPGKIVIRGLRLPR